MSNAFENTMPAPFEEIILLRCPTLRIGLNGFHCFFCCKDFSATIDYFAITCNENKTNDSISTLMKGKIKKTNDHSLLTKGDFFLRVTIEDLPVLMRNRRVRISSSRILKIFRNLILLFRIDAVVNARVSFDFRKDAIFNSRVSPEFRRLVIFESRVSFNFRRVVFAHAKNPFFLSEDKDFRAADIKCLKRESESEMKMKMPF
jgi:hypothetical protein